MKFRIKQYKQGWVVEIQKRRWYGKKYWSVYIKVSGSKTVPWFFSNEKYAMRQLLDVIRRQTLRNSGI